MDGYANVIGMDGSYGWDIGVCAWRLMMSGECDTCGEHCLDCKCGEWIKGNIYPKKHGIYLCHFPSGRTHVAYFTVVTSEKGDRKSCGKWGSEKPGRLNYIPLKNPLAWKSVTPPFGTVTGLKE